MQNKQNEVLTWRWREKTAHKSHLVKSMQTKFYCWAASHKHSFQCKSGPFLNLNSSSMGAHSLASNEYGFFAALLVEWRYLVEESMWPQDYTNLSNQKDRHFRSSSCISLHKVFAFPFFFSTSFAW